jgi:transposase
MQDRTTHAMPPGIAFPGNRRRRSLLIMIPLSPATRIYLAAGATDLRKRFEGLSDLVTHQFKENPLNGHLYVFANRKRKRIKSLYFEGSGT